MAEDTPAPQLKRCTRCKRVRGIDNFSVDRKRKDGLNVWCKPCKSKARRREYLRVKRELRCGVQLELDLGAKVCPRCKTMKLCIEFGKSKQRKDGLAPYCRSCTKIQMSETYKRTQEAWSERTRRWRAENKKRSSEISMRRNARRKSATLVPFTKEQLDAKWDYWAGKCWICGSIATASDHVKPLSKGGAHILCNLRPICKPCNSRKSASWPFDVEWIRSQSAVA